MAALLTAFESDTFDAETAVPAPSVSPADAIREGIDQQIAFFSRLLPLLRPDQRAKLASSLENRGMRDHDDD